ncbi:hypothetical protein AUR64_03820 [Haloprofundus marisrubri]|uniref:Uncharacterized protein n=1 Tax=Haloprofundus marisrubri TaxID=1514971 RepID=A0A0W1RDA9_9EURY|nr:hypothetical protein AUR64_03820 [Haloprofundus marisrubri]
MLMDLLKVPSMSSDPHSEFAEARLRASIYLMFGKSNNENHRLKIAFSRSRNHLTKKSNLINPKQPDILTERLSY